MAQFLAQLTKRNERPCAVNKYKAIRIGCADAFAISVGFRHIFHVVEANFSFQLESDLKQSINSAKKEIVYPIAKDQFVTLRIEEKKTVSKAVDEMKSRYSKLGYRNAAVQNASVYPYKGAVVHYIDNSKKMYAGFVVFQIKDNVIAVEHKYGFEVGDGMGSRTIVPLAFISQSLGAAVKWDAVKGAAIITQK